MPKPGWIEGLGELIRSHRKYTGLSQRSFADKLGIKELSLVDIEIGRRDCPEKLLERVYEVVDEFDRDVKQVMAKADEMLDGDEEQKITLTVTDEPEQDYQRAVVGRAAVDHDQIVPILDGRYSREARTG